MSSPLFFNNKIHLDTYESENSEYFSENKLKNYQSFAYNLFYTIERIYIERVSGSFNKLYHLFATKAIKELCLSTDANLYNYDSQYNINHINPNNELGVIKLQILKTKLSILTNIIKSYVIFYQIGFFQRLKLKIEMLKFFNKDDNYLYILPKPKLFRFRNIYAYRRLLYVIKSYKSRICLIKRNCFSRWKDKIIINELKIENNYNKRLSTYGFFISNLFQKVEKIFVNNSFLFSLSKLMFYTLLDLSRNKNQNKLKISLIRKNNNEFIKFYTEKLKSFFELYLKLDKLTLELKNNLKYNFFFKLMKKCKIKSKKLNTSKIVFDQELKHEIEIFKQNILQFLSVSEISKHFERIDRICEETVTNYINNIHNKSKIKKIYLIMKGLLLIYSKNFVNKKLSQNFQKLKKQTYYTEPLKFEEIKKNHQKVLNKKYDNSLALLSKILHFKFNYSNNNYFHKKEFFEKLIFIIKIRNTCKEYGKQYNKIHLKIFNQFSRRNMLLLRKVFQKLYALKKLFILVSNNKTKIGERKIKSTNNYLFNNEIMIISSCFYKWKQLTINNITKDTLIYIHLNYLVKIQNKLKNLYCLNFFENLKNISELYHLKSEKLNYLNLSKNLFFILNKFFDKRNQLAFTKIYKLLQFSEIIDRNIKIKKVLFYQLAKTCKNEKNKLITYEQIKNFYFNLWVSKTNFTKFTKIAYLETENSEISENNNLICLDSNINLYKRLVKIKIMFERKYEKDLRFYFTKYKINIALSKNTKVFSKSKFVHKIDFLIVENQSKVLIDYENEEMKLIREIVTNKFSMNRGAIYAKIIFKNYLHKISKFFKIWKREIFKKPYRTYEDILNDAEIIRNDRDNLYNLYTEKKVNYKKTIEDYEFIKKQFCEDCINEGDYILDYKTILPDDTEIGVEVEYNNTEFENEKENSVCQENLSKKIPEMEKKIKSLQKDYENKLENYEKFIKTYEEKKKVKKLLFKNYFF